MPQLYRPIPPVCPMTSSATASICAGLAALCRSAASPYRCWESDTPPTSALCAAHRTPEPPPSTMDIGMPSLWRISSTVRTMDFCGSTGNPPQRPQGQRNSARLKYRISFHQSAPPVSGTSWVCRGDHLPDTRFRPDAEYPVRRKPVIPLESPRGRLGHLSPGTVNLPRIVPKIPQQMLLLLRRQRPHLTLLRHTARTGSRDKSAYRFRRWR